MSGTGSDKKENNYNSCSTKFSLKKASRLFFGSEKHLIYHKVQNFKP